jgi:hypothetical protein
LNSTATNQGLSKTSLAPFVSLKHRDFRLLWIAQCVSLAGTQMQLVTINWHIYLLTGSAVALGLIGVGGNKKDTRISRGGSLAEMVK